MNKLILFAVTLFLVGHAVAGYALPQQDLSEEGIQAYQAHDFPRAEEAFTALVQRDPSATNFSLLGMSEAATGKLDQAVTHFKQSIRLGNHSAIIYYNLGLAYLERKENATGAREIQLALSIDPTFRSARYTLAVVLLDAGRPREALPQLIQLREESPCDAAVWANLARAQFEAGDDQAALHTIDEATRGMAHNVPLFVTSAEICERQHQPQRARNLLESANELRPDDPDIELLLAKAALEAREPVEALAVLKDVPASQGMPGVVSFTRGLAMELTGQNKAAEKELSAAVEANPLSVRYLVALAWVYQLEDRHEEALATLGKAREQDPHNAVVLYRMAVSSFLMLRYSEVIQYCNETIQLVPHYDPPYLLSGLARFEEGDAAGAQAAVQQAIKLAPGKSFYHRELGVILLKRGELEQSKKELDLAVTLDPKAAPNYLSRARTLESLGDNGAALRDLEITVALQPDNRDAYSELARLYSKAGQPQKAADALAQEKAVKTNVNSEYSQGLLSGVADPLE